LGIGVVVFMIEKIRRRENDFDQQKKEMNE